MTRSARITAALVDLNAVREALSTRAAEIAVALLGEPNRAMSNRREWRFRRKGGLAVVVAGPKAGHWFDHELGIGGDLIDLIQHTRRRDFLAALRYAESFIGSMPPVRPVPAPSERATATDDSKQNQERALRIWREAQPIAYTPAAAYLAQRRVLEVTLPIDGTVLRFHPRCPFGENTRLPCMVALLRDVQTDEPKAIMRTAVTAFGEKVGRKVLGRKTGTAVKIAPANGTLVISEGVETALSAVSFGFVPAWALGDAGELAKFPVLAGIEALTIIVDHDAAGQAATSECSRRWAEAGREVFHVVPRGVGEDLNDCLPGQGAVPGRY
jgi:hypothetical protein